MKQETCRNGHVLTRGNRTKSGGCLTCQREARGWQGNPPNRQKSVCPAGHPYRGRNVRYYMRDGTRIRVCVACKRERERKRYWERIKPVKHPGKPGRPRVRVQPLDT